MWISAATKYFFTSWNVHVQCLYTRPIYIWGGKFFFLITSSSLLKQNAWKDFCNFLKNKIIWKIFFFRKNFIVLNILISHLHAFQCFCYYAYFANGFFKLTKLAITQAISLNSGRYKIGCCAFKMWNSFICFIT